MIEGTGLTTSAGGDGAPRHRRALSRLAAIPIWGLHALREANSSLVRERRRVLPMALGIVFGMMVVMVLLAVAGGFEASQRRALEAYGDRFVLVRLNRAELDRAAGSEERRLQMDSRDIDALRTGAPAIRRLSPVNMAYRARIYGRTGAAGSNAWLAGVLPEITRIRNIPLAEGRFFDELDEAERRRVVVLGPVARKQLFGSGPCIGRTVRITGFATTPIGPPLDLPQGKSTARGAGALAAVRGTSTPATFSVTASSSSSSTATSSSPSSSNSSAATTSPGSPAARAGRSLEISAETFEVIGVLKDLETTKESYVSVARMAYVPYATSTAVFDRRFITLLIEPRSIDEKDLALTQLKQVLGARYGFDPEDRNAVIIYFDAIERAQSIRAIFGGLRLFLAIVGILILGIGGIGVMNVVLVSVASRTFEIGLRKALGATPTQIYAQFFLETALACFLSGLVGFLLGALGIAVLGALPLPESISRPVLDLRTAGISFGILSATAVLVGFYPARRAARLAPVAALQGRGI